MTQTYVVADPRSFEGTPYEVAARAVAQLGALVALTTETLDASEVMIRNAELSRNLYETPEDARADEWENSPQGRKLAGVREKLEALRKELSVLQRAAGFDPRAV